MAIGTLIELGMKAKNAYNGAKRDPEIPVPGRAKAEMPIKAAPVKAAPVKAAPPTSKEKANQAADMLKIPGRDIIRGAAAKRKQMLDDL